MPYKFDLQLDLNNDVMEIIKSYLSIDLHFTIERIHKQNNVFGLAKMESNSVYLEKILDCICYEYSTGYSEDEFIHRIMNLKILSKICDKDFDTILEFCVNIIDDNS